MASERWRASEAGGASGRALRAGDTSTILYQIPEKLLSSALPFLPVHRAVAQSGLARLLGVQEVASSNLAGPTNLSLPVVMAARSGSDLRVVAAA